MSESGQIIKWMTGISNGTITIDDVPANWRGTILAAMYREIWGEAVKVLDSRTPAERRASLDRLNGSMRPLVEAEARRIFEARKAERR